MDRTQTQHYTRISDYFNGATFLEPKQFHRGPTDTLANPLIVHFTNRSGSHYLCDLLSKAGQRRNLNEALNWDTVVNHSQERGYKSFAQYYLDFICSEPSIIKVNRDQLFMLAKWGFLRVPPNNSPARKPFLVTIKRNDVIAQAVSFSIALQTKQFTSLQKTAIDESSILFKPDEIAGIIRAIGVENQDFLLIAAALEHDVFTIVYEDLLSDPARCLSGILKRIDAKQSMLKTDSIYTKQSSNINDIFRSRYVETLALTTNSRPTQITQKIPAK